MAQQNNRRISVTVSEATHAALSTRAAKENAALATFVRTLLDDYLGSPASAKAEKSKKKGKGGDKASSKGKKRKDKGKKKGGGKGKSGKKK